ncbi:MAG: hypothetical protein AB7E49_10300 [Campylobacterales bacterium]
MNNLTVDVQQVKKLTKIFEHSEFNDQGIDRLINAGHSVVSAFEDKSSSEVVKSQLDIFLEHYEQIGSECPFRSVKLLYRDLAGAGTACRPVECVDCSHPKSSAGIESGCNPKRWDFCPFNPAYTPDYIRQADLKFSSDRLGLPRC